MPSFLSLIGLSSAFAVEQSKLTASCLNFQEDGQADVTLCKDQVLSLFSRLASLEETVSTMNATIASMNAAINGLGPVQSQATLRNAGGQFVDSLHLQASYSVTEPGFYTVEVHATPETPFLAPFLSPPATPSTCSVVYLGPKRRVGSARRIVGCGRWSRLPVDPVLRVRGGFHFIDAFPSSGHA